MRHALATAAAILATFAGTPAAFAQTGAPVIIGVAAPLSDSPAILGKQVVDGVGAAMVRLRSDDTATEIVTADTACSQDGGQNAARQLIEAKATVAVGFLCTEAIEAALPLLTRAGIPTLDVGVRASRLTDKRARTGFLVWRLAPRATAEADAIAALLAKRWRDRPFGLIDDGTIYNRSLSDAVRLRLEGEGMQPSTIDTYRPAEEKQFGLARRLQRTGVTRFFIAGDRPDVAIIARDAADLGLSLEVVGGESLFDETSPDAPLPTGVTAVGPQVDFPAFPARDDAAPEGHFGVAAAAADIAVQAAKAARIDGTPLNEVLNTTSFDTPLGAVRFDENGDSNLELYRTYRWDGERFVLEEGG
ncbi:ABC transporter substrate-binding protein [Consotaella aegiceratis]|uniref:ABC transporter substrate-binding protein n=1 Tax=Consotaella aegiceratis TaxID=3097961 RepID=UPI002F3F76CC